MLIICKIFNKFLKKSLRSYLKRYLKYQFTIFSQFFSNYFNLSIFSINSFEYLYHFDKSILKEVFDDNQIKILNEYSNIKNAIGFLIK